MANSDFCAALDHELCGQHNYAVHWAVCADLSERADYLDGMEWNSSHSNLVWAGLGTGDARGFFGQFRFSSGGLFSRRCGLLPSLARICSKTPASSLLRQFLLRRFAAGFQGHPVFVWQYAIYDAATDVAFCDYE